MPYLSRARKHELDAGIRPTTPGDLTYLLTRVALGESGGEATFEEAVDAAVERYFERRDIRYASFAEVLGCLLSAKLEYARRVCEDQQLRNALASPAIVGYKFEQYIKDFYRNRVAPYEDQKIEENGDVYP